MSKLNMQIDGTAQIVENTRNYLKNNSYQSLVNTINKEVIGQSIGVGALCLQVYKWLISVANENPKSHNTILAAPSGSGKTAFYHAIKEALLELGIPIINFDASSLTPVGYVGNTFGNILDELCNVNSDCQGIGICFLDEMDKIFTPSVCSSGMDFHKEAQSCLLKLIEGSVYTKKDKNGKKMLVDTSNTLFIAMGAFQDIRENQIRESCKSIGFSNQEKASPKNVYSEITEEDIIKCGAQVELVGRFEKTVNYSRLSRKSLELIINKVANELLDFENWKISISKKSVDELIKYIDNDRGIRFIRAKLSNSLDTIMPKLLADDYMSKTYSIKIKSLDNVTYTAINKDIKAESYDIYELPMLNDEIKYAVGPF